MKSQIRGPHFSLLWRTPSILQQQSSCCATAVEQLKNSFWKILEGSARGPRGPPADSWSPQVRTTPVKPETMKFHSWWMLNYHSVEKIFTNQNFAFTKSFFLARKTEIFLIFWLRFADFLVWTRIPVQGADIDKLKIPKFGRKLQKKVQYLFNESSKMKNSDSC